MRCQELARQLAAQLRLTSPAETTPDTGFDEERRLPRVGDRSFDTDTSRGRNDLDGGERVASVEYHAMDSDTEDAFYAEPPRDAWPMGSAAERREHPQGLDGPPGNFYLKSSGDFQVFFGVEKKDQVNSYDIMYCHFCE
eukprot:g7232.t1